MPQATESRWRARRSALLLAVVGAFVLALGQVPAYERYYDPNDPLESGNCKSCHPQFDQRGPLHDLHVGSGKFTSTCDVCHVVRGDNPQTSKKGVPGYYGCASCHGRDYGRQTPTGDPVMESFGLRWRHVFQQDVPICATCHDLDTEPLPESVKPPIYGTVSAFILNSSCNVNNVEDGDESWKTPDPEPETLGLDNDGDGLYDGADPDCQRAGPARIVNVRWMALDSMAWTDSPDATGYQVLRGSIADLVAAGGSMAGASCAASGLAANLFNEAAAPAGPGAWYYLVRGTSGGARGTYESDGPMQAGTRDTSATACP